MKKMIVLGAMLLPVLLYAQKVPFTIKGKIGKLNAPARAWLQYFKNGESILDSSAITNGSFSFSGQVDGPVESGQVIIDAKGDGKTVQSRSFGFHAILLFLEKGTITIESPAGPDEAVIGGTPTNIEYNRFNKTKQVLTLDSAINANWDRWSASLSMRPRDTALTRKAGGEWYSFFSAKHAVERQYMKAHPDSYVSMLFLEISTGSFNADTIAPLYSQLSSRVRNTPAGREIATKLELARSLGVGAYAPDFTEKDTSGRSLSLSSFRGKYLLLDFWASWCGPCRAETPQIREVYKQYKDKNFTILSVSLDRGRKEWVEAIVKDEMTWAHVSALQYWQDPVAKKYNISGIPQNLLLDPSGKIVARNLKGEALEKKLAELLKG